ncbi:MAG: hypothetical protein AAFX02_09150, partial [Pseudomonadota bacterium]
KIAARAVPVCFSMAAYSSIIDSSVFPGTISPGVKESLLDVKKYQLRGFVGREERSDTRQFGSQSAAGIASLLPPY